MSGCNKCCGNCGGCGEMVLSEGELGLLTALSQIPFLPVARRVDCPEPIYLDDSILSPEEAANCLLCLEKRGLVSLDYDQPLRGDWKTYEAAPIRGSFALTAKGQEILELMDLQGISQE